MRQLAYATSNKVKFNTAVQLCKPFQVTLQQVTVDISEIQGSDGLIIARDKAQRTYDALQQPLIISDDSWIIPGLQGFPGPYMKYMNQWFSETDWARLVQPLKDRRIILRQIIVHQDATGQHVFSTDVEGMLLDSPRGASPSPHITLVSFDNGATSVAEAIEQNGSALGSTNRTSSWHALCAWLNTQGA